MSSHRIAAPTRFASAHPGTKWLSPELDRHIRLDLDKPVRVRERLDYGASGSRVGGAGVAPPGAGDGSTAAIPSMSGSSWSVSAILV